VQQQHIQKPGSASVPFQRQHSTAEQARAHQHDTAKLHSTDTLRSSPPEPPARSMARLLPPAAAAAIVAAVLVAGLPGARAASASPAADDAPPYRNHTVGGGDGWFFDANTNASSGNYSDWAAGETFYLGDYLSTSPFFLTTYFASPRPSLLCP
jgi:hypothetical protein